MISIINGLEDMFRIKVPVLDVFASNDWSVTRVGGDERLAQIRRIAGSKQIVVAGTEHFFEGHREELTRDIVAFLDAAFSPKQ
jgi:alpha/beta superfamily hydrolase